MKKLFLLLVLNALLTVPSAHALTLVYDGFLCQDGSDIRSQWPGQSSMEVASFRGFGMYQLEISGGVINIDREPCINRHISLIKNAGQTFQPAESIVGTAFFDGMNLVIIISRYTSVLNADIYPEQFRYISSLVHVTDQYYFDYDEENMIFILRNAVTQTDGFVQTFSGMESINPFIVYQRPSEPVILRLTDF